jgi:type I restriction enzyme R subunit
VAITSEADARILIDDQLRAAGWDPADKSQVRTEVPVTAFGGVAVSGASTDFPRTSDDDSLKVGRSDYVLYDQRGRPLAVVEAKKNAIHPYVAKQQALPYAKQVGASFIFLANGRLIYFWDFQNDDAHIVDSFYSRRDLERIVQMREDRKPLATIPIPETYTRQGETRVLRPYQTEAMQALDHALELGKRRFLIELPTGCGKTDLVVLYLKRLFEANRAERVLFLVDRDQLAKQAIEAVQDLLPSYSSYWLKSGVARQEKQITVCLLQTMIGRYEEFTSGYFDVVIADECHRSIYGVWQTALTRFDAFHIGLTATPAVYIERNTFDFYHCKNNTPDFSYTIQEAFQHGYLVPYKFATGITTLMSEGADKDDEHYDPVKFERDWTNAATNKLMVEEFDRLAWQDYRELAAGQKIGPGKAVVFAITKHHAARLAEYLNQLHPEHHGRYAEVITSDVADADELIRRFKREDYPQIAVSVGMLDTGFDCPTLLHLVMCRRVRSPILYQQMRGRGTRTAPFSRSMLPCRRVATFSAKPTAFGDSWLSRNFDAVSQAITVSAAFWPSALVSSSVMPSLKYCCFGSPLRLVKGSTASVPAGGLKCLALEAAAAASVAAGALRRTK